MTIQPIVLNTLSKEKFNLLMGMAMEQYVAGECSPVEEFEAELNIVEKETVRGEGIANE